MSAHDCIIYCTGNLPILELRKRIARLLETNKVEGSFIENNYYEISARVNDEFDINKQLNFPDGFLYFKFKLEIGFRDDNINASVPVISKILKWLWETQMPAVASWNDEDLLPENGGYKSKKIPWPSN